MGRIPRFRQFLDKADAALLSAIEIYNKPLREGARSDVGRELLLLRQRTDQRMPRQP